MARSSNPKPQINLKGCKVKKCTKCLVVLGETNWHLSAKMHRTYVCKPCFKTFPSQQFDAHKNYKLKRYGISIDEYKELSRSQNHKCAICKKREGVKTKRLQVKSTVSLAVDHCHKTGKVRGLLCMKCNRGLGNLRDSVDNLKSAIVYLRKNEGH